MDKRNRTCSSDESEDQKRIFPPVPKYIGYQFIKVRNFQLEKDSFFVVGKNGFIWFSLDKNAQTEDNSNYKSSRFYYLCYMKNVTLAIPENKFKTFINFVKTLDYVKVVDTDKSVVKELESSLKQVKLMQSGELPKKSVKQFLDEVSS
jgi:hypothetical protein